MRLSITAFVALILSFSGPVQATNYTFTNSTLNNRWPDAENWNPNGVPTIGDHVLIPAGKLCIVSEADGGQEVNTFEVEATAELRLNDFLVVYGNFAQSTSGTSIVDGLVTVHEQPINNIYGQLTFSVNDHFVQGSGTIRGHGGRLRVIGKRLYNELATSGKAIRGQLRIQGQQVNNAGGIFRNLGLVDAEGEGNVLELSDTTTLEDDEAAVWRTATCGTLVFKKQALSLVGDFLCGGTSAATFKFEATVRTCGTYTRSGGGIDVDTGKTFDYAYFAVGANSCATNPGTAPCDEEPQNPCLCKFIVSSDVAPCGPLCQ